MADTAGGDVTGDVLGRDGRDAPAGLTAGDGDDVDAGAATDDVTLASGVISAARTGSADGEADLSGWGVATISGLGAAADPLGSTRDGSLVLREAT